MQWVSVPQTPGEYRIKLRYYRIGGSVEEFDYQMAIVPAAQRAYSDGVGNTMLRWDGTFAPLDKPLLVVEGIDAEDVNTEAHYYGLGAVLFGRGRARGADVLILNFGDGGADMRVNAEVVETAIRYINQIKVSSRKLDVAGVSMGGVIVRYALNEMEREGPPHNVGRFVSMDAPLRGAVLDRNLLDFAADHPPAPAAIRSMAGFQLLVYNPLDTRLPSEHVRFFNELNGPQGGMYPTQTTENVGIAFSTSAPNPDVGEQWLEVVGSIPGGWDNSQFYIEAGSDESVPGSWLPREQSQIAGFLEGVEDYGSRLSISRIIDSSTIASLDAGSVS